MFRKKMVFWGNISMSEFKGPGKRGYIVADTLLPTQMFPCLPARATFVADTNFVSGTQKLLLILFINIYVSQFAQPKKHHEQQRVLVCQYLKAGLIPFFQINTSPRTTPIFFFDIVIWLT